MAKEVALRVRARAISLRRGLTVRVTSASHVGRTARTRVGRRRQRIGSAIEGFSVGAQSGGYVPIRKEVHCG
jgi:hypothetical protein